MTDTLSARPVPALGKPRTGKLPTVADQMLDNGLRVLAVRRPGVPLVELRLRIPLAGKGDAHVAKAQLLGDTLLSGTDRRDASQIAIDLQSYGGQLNASVDADRLGISGSVLSSGFGGILDLLGELLTSASYPKDEVVAERDRLVQELAIYRSQAGVVAREALLARMYGTHPYATELPEAEAVEAVTAGQLRSLHAKRVAPAGSILTVVGDLPPTKLVAQVEQALAAWTADVKAAETGPLPAVPSTPLLLVDRPGSVQTTIRMARDVPSRTSEEYASLSLANMVFGGYFSSRWSANLREDKGYTYGTHSSFEHPPAGSRLVLSTDVATGVTAPALLETWYELGRVATLPVGQDELDQARRYAIGSLQVGAASQGGLASLLSMLAGSDLGVDYLREFPAQLQAVTVESAQAAAATYLTPKDLTTVVVGDATEIATSVEGLFEVERA
ncbi:MAG: insulinase family protein [Actinobacteria bacterium]|nr:insulinase family protein [Actinomycetota bacterium]MCA1721437.1 insulinase family protein [Actinomycetota bacterium]